MSDPTSLPQADTAGPPPAAAADLPQAAPSSLPQESVAQLPQAPVWYQDGLRFACTQCGNCCSGAPGYVWVQADEIDRIASFLNLTREQFAKKHLRRVGVRYSLLERPGGDCEFLERTGGHSGRTGDHGGRAGDHGGCTANHGGRTADRAGDRTGGKTRCRIHPVRPVQCRTWPFWKSNVASEEDWAAAGEGCPGIGQGPLYTAEFIAAALRENGRRPL